MTENDRHLIKIVLILITHIIEYSNIIKDQYYDNIDSKSNNSTYYKLYKSVNKGHWIEDGHVGCYQTKLH